MTDTCILIPSCDSFSDVWGPCMECLRRFWPECPFPVYTISNDLPFKGENVENIRVGVDSGWSANLVKALDQIPQPLVLMFLEDMLIESVDNVRVLEAVNWMSANDSIVAARLGSGPEEYRPSQLNDKWGVVLSSSQYRCSTSPTLWRKEYLREIAALTGTPWGFEIEGTKFSRRMLGQVIKAIPPAIAVHYTAVTRGAWERGALRFLEQHGIGVDTKHRGITGV